MDWMLLVAAVAAVGAFAYIAIGGVRQFRRTAEIRRRTTEARKQLDVDKRKSEERNRAFDAWRHERGL